MLTDGQKQRAREMTDAEFKTHMHEMYLEHRQARIRALRSEAASLDVWDAYEKAQITLRADVASVKYYTDQLEGWSTERGQRYETD